MTALELKMSLKLTQQLVMTPQLQLAIRLLQLNRMELLDLVAKELQENPVLEETQERPDSEELQRISQEIGEPPLSNDVKTPEEAPLSVAWEDYIGQDPYPGARYQGSDDDRPPIEANLTRKPSLTDHLLWQVRMGDFGEEEPQIAGMIIGNIDEDGYLQATIEEIAEHVGADLGSVEAVLLRIQDFDPPGVAARDLRECLLLQAKFLGHGTDIVTQVIADHLPKLEKKDCRSIARALGVPMDKVVEAARIISGMEPKPGRPFSTEEPHYIIPDIYVHKVGDEYVILLNEDGIPKLRISNFYREVLHNNKGTSRVTKEYVQEHTRSALWLIKSIYQRQRTVYRVMKSIIRFQREFFDRGITCLKPLNLRDIAEDISMHESTISRVTTNKYVHCPQGIYELKYFFNSSINLTGGESIASESVKDEIRRIILQENRERPLSDQRIVEILQESDIHIARRTVTKYRENLRILSSTKRKSVLN